MARTEMVPIYIAEFVLERWGMKTGTRESDNIDFKKLPKQQVLNSIDSDGLQASDFSLADPAFREQLDVWVARWIHNLWQH